MRDEILMFWMIGCSPWFLEGVRLNCRVEVVMQGLTSDEKG
jgi:hypothetical protein